MAVDGRPRGGRVARGDRGGDRLVQRPLVLGAAVPQPQRRRVGVHPGPQLAGQHRAVHALVDRRQVRVGRGAHHRRVEHGVRGDQFGDGSAGVPQPAEGREDRGVQFRAVRRGEPRPALGRLPDAGVLQPQPQVHQVPGRVPVQVEHEVHRRGDHRLGPADHVGARPVPDLHQAHQGQRPQRLADRRPAGAEPLGQLAFRRQPRALGEALPDDQVPDLRGHVVGPARGGDRRNAGQRYRRGPALAMD